MGYGGTHESFSEVEVLDVIRKSSAVSLAEEWGSQWLGNADVIQLPVSFRFILLNHPSLVLASRNGLRLLDCKSEQTLNDVD